MPHSYAQQIPVTCPHCGHEFSFDVWLIVDTAERPDLVEGVRAGTLHAAKCPRCRGDCGAVDAPLLVFRQDAGPAVVFSPAGQTTSEQDTQQAVERVGRLHEAMGDSVRREWVKLGVRVVSRAMLPVVLSDDPEGGVAENG